jgi:PAS domain S-box-containing protein
MRDVTQQKQREHRLALQLVVSQIVGENSSSDVAVMRILEALCVSQGWDMAVKWGVNTEEKHLEFGSAWAARDAAPKTFIQESMGLTLAKASTCRARLAGWPPHLVRRPGCMPAGPRVQAALRHEMVSGWAIPVREGNKVLAVLEFYCHFAFARRPRSPGRRGNRCRLAGTDAGALPERGRAEELSASRRSCSTPSPTASAASTATATHQLCQPRRRAPAGRAAASLTGKPVHELLHGGAPPNRHVRRGLPAAPRLGRQKAAAGEDTIFRADGSSFPAEYVLTPIADQGRFSGSVLSFRDISQRYALDRLKDEFISTVSHELRTPLTSIRGALGLLSSGILGEVNDKAANLLRIALTNSDRLVRLINDILDLERIQSGASRWPSAGAAGADRAPGHRRHGSRGRCRRRAADPRHHPG